MVDLQSLVLVRAELVKLGLQPVGIAIGEADVLEELTLKQQVTLRVALRQSGLELLENKTEILVHRIERTIMDAVYNGQAPLLNLSDYLSHRLGYDYTYMSNLFSDTKKTTIEKFYICHKIERVKQLLLYERLTLSAIAEKMHYSSLAHLSSQFKKVTGSTPSQFKQENRNKHPPPGHCG
jgi:AraC-like DNA-binding protein